MVDHLDIGASYLVVDEVPLGRWCICTKVLRPGDVVQVAKRPSPNRVLILTDSGYHKVRASTLRLHVEATR
jgi:hypothetical protein